MPRSLASSLLALAALAGCGEYDIETGGGRSAAPEAVGIAIDPMNPPPAAATAPDSEPAEPPEDTVREQAQVGAGKKGHYSPGIITTPLSTYFRAQERIAYEIEIPKAMQLYQATNNRYPRTREEFEREILAPARITLPELPEGHRYVYDPEKGELLVERPK